MQTGWQGGWFFRRVRRLTSHNCWNRLLHWSGRGSRRRRLLILNPFTLHENRSRLIVCLNIICWFCLLWLDRDNRRNLGVFLRQNIGCCLSKILHLRLTLIGKMRSGGRLVCLFCRESGRGCRIGTYGFIDGPFVHRRFFFHFLSTSKEQTGDNI